MNMTPRVVLSDYRFFDLEVHWVPGPGELQGVVEPDVAISEVPEPAGPFEHLIRLDLSAAPPPEQAGYRISLSIVGVFRTETDGQDYSREALRDIAALNGSAILYGIVRAEIASLTSNFPPGRMLLPAVYMHEILKQQSENAASNS